MELKTWVNAELGRGAKLVSHLDSVARTVNPEKSIRHAQLTGWIADRGAPTYRPIPVYLAQAIEQFTEGKVMRWDCCPDTWFTVWPELHTHRDAPPIPKFDSQPAAAG